MDIEIDNLIDELKSLLTLDGKHRIFEQSQELESNSLKEVSDPEAVTKEIIVEPIIRAFGLKKLPEKHFDLPYGKLRKVDYRIKNDKDVDFLVEVKPLNADLFKDEDSGAVTQIKELFLLAEVKENYQFGIATDGIKWVFVDKNGYIVYKLDMIKNKQRIKELLGGTELSLEHVEEEISKKFYEWYNALLHGGHYRDHEGKSRNISENDCLIKNIFPVSAITDAEQIAQTILNRLIFIKFLQSNGIIERDTLDYLTGLDESRLNYELRQLFFEVLNTEISKRNDVNAKFKSIPYLNGSLFVRTEVESKYSDYKIKANILKEIIIFLNSFKFIHKEEFGDTRDTLNPEILGYIFEKAMTAIDRSGTGAYYTPKDVTKYISNNTIQKKIIERADSILKNKKNKSVKTLRTIGEVYKLDSPELKEIFNSIIIDLKVCDNACGSGSFLLAAADTLLEIITKINSKLSLGLSEIEIKKIILKNSLYGVDINPNAIEIAKLRLWLWLASSYNSERVEPLTNIEYNIMLGNSLVGYTDITKFKEQKLSIRDWLQSDGESLKLMLIKRARNISEYKDQSGDRRKEFKIKIEENDKTIKELLDIRLFEEINRRNKISETDFKTLKPFHWGFEFGDLNGFDIIVGNPPYGNILSPIEKKALSNFETINSNEIAANFIERTLHLLKNQGATGLIVTNSIAINASTFKARELIRRYMLESKMALFGTRPAKIFADAEIRVLIFIGQRDNPQNTGTIYTTEAIKFTKNQRAILFDNLSFESTEGLSLGKKKIGDGLEDASLPKIGNKTIRDVLIRLKTCSEIVVGDVINKKGFEYKMQFRKTGGYWLNALEKMPYLSTKIETIKFESALGRDFGIILINSSLFYLYWSTYGNLRDFPLSLLERFPFPSQMILQEHKKKIDSLKIQISTKLTNSFVADRGRVGEFKTATCKENIDEIDELLGRIYGLNKMEIKFIQNYDLHIRKL